MGFWDGVASIGEGWYSMLSWMNPKTDREILEEMESRMQKLYDRMGWGSYKNPNSNEEWHYIERLIPTLPEPQQAKTPIRCPARKYNRR